MRTKTATPAVVVVVPRWAVRIPGRRGNLQLAAQCFAQSGTANLGVATPSKLIGLEAVRINTGDEALDAAFEAKRFIKFSKASGPLG